MPDFECESRRVVDNGRCETGARWLWLGDNRLVCGVHARAYAKGSLVNLGDIFAIELVKLRRGEMSVEDKKRLRGIAGV